MFFLRLALLSVLSHRRRSTVIAASVALSVLVMIFVEGMLGGLRLLVLRESPSGTGHCRSTPRGGRIGWTRTLSFVLHDPHAMIRRIRGPVHLTRLSRVEPMLQFGALLVHGDRNVAMVGQAVEPTTRFFANVRKNMLAGSFLRRWAFREPGVAISSNIARLLGLRLGDPVVVLVQDSTGSPYYLGYTVTGIFSTGVAADR